MSEPGIFISWSGDISRTVANCLRQSLPLIYRVQPWLSTRDLPPGRPWLPELLGQLQKCHIGILVVTADNIDSPWMQFEAGALCKNFDQSRVFPFLVGLEPTNLRGPFAQIQAIPADKPGTLKLVESIRATCVPDEPIETTRERFTAFWPRIAKQLNGASQSKRSAKEGISPSPTEYQLKVDLLEERIASLTDLMKDVVRSWSPSQSPTLAGNAISDSETGLSAFVGAWFNTDTGSYCYGRIVNGVLHMPYCYSGDNELTSAFTQWTKTGALWFARFKWFRRDIQGFSFYKPVGPNAFEGQWWRDDGDNLTDIQKQEVMSKGTHPEGITTRWERIPSRTVPDWAQEYFRNVSKRA